MRLESAVASDIGKVRTRNEDAYLLLPEKGIFAVADGMGGHAAGDVASRTALESVSEISDGDVVSAVLRANRAVSERAQREPQLAGMGTTLTLLALQRDKNVALLGHVGDTRSYLFRAGKLQQLTRDHTVAQEMVDAGQLTKDTARNHPASSMLQRAIGTQSEVDVDFAEIDVQSADLFLLCSDGLTGMLSDGEIARILENEKPLQQLADELVEAANQRGGRDNITSLLVRVG
jgi:protein phosphatase